MSLQLTPELEARIEAVKAEAEASLSLPIKVSKSAVIKQLLEEALDAREQARPRAIGA